MRVFLGYFALTVAQIILRPSAIGFTVSNFAQRRVHARGLRHVWMRASLTDVQQPASSVVEIPEQYDVTSVSLSSPDERKIPAEINNALVGFVTASTTWFAGAPGAIAYVDPDNVGDIANSDLPPIWVPVAVLTVLVVGIGLLQGSLGDVMNDEAKLGGMSGARAGKQSARDRSMFKKKNEDP